MHLLCDRLMSHVMQQSCNIIHRKADASVAEQMDYVANSAASALQQMLIDMRHKSVAEQMHAA